MSVAPGLSEAATDALIALMDANLSLLNARLATSGLPAFAAVVSSQVVLGDPDTLPPSATSPLWFAVIGGQCDDGVELTPFQSTFGDNHPYENPYSATITAYVHPQTVLSSDPFTNESVRHRLLSRLSDWLRADVFNTPAGLLITIASGEYSDAPGGDQIKGGALRRIRRADAMKGAGRNIAVPCIRHDFEGVIK